MFDAVTLTPVAAETVLDVTSFSKKARTEVAIFVDEITNPRAELACAPKGITAAFVAMFETVALNLPVLLAATLTSAPEITWLSRILAFTV